MYQKRYIRITDIWQELSLFYENYIRPELTDMTIRRVEMEQDKTNKQHGNTYVCLNKRRTINIFFEYIEKKFEMIANRIHFSFFWSTSYTHDYLNFPKLIDTDLVDFLRLTKSTGALDNLFLIVMSDHGIRWGEFRDTYQGTMEERQPFVFMVPPERFSQEYPEAMRNLVRNRRRLTTPFDLYETLRDLSELKKIESRMIRARANKLQQMKPMPRGISLFLPIPETRTCYDAAIEPHWCTCHEHRELAVTDPRVTEVARVVVDHLNDVLKPHPECQRLLLNAVLNANLGTSSASLGNATNQFVDIIVRIQTKPGLGHFEATVRVHDAERYEITGTVSRTNMYGKQSHCVDDRNMKLYCFCNNQTQE